MKDWKWMSWYNVGLIVITVVFIKWAWALTVPSELLLLSYSLITVYPKLLSKFISIRFGGGQIVEEKKDEKL